jgi:hypothetical protein
MAHAVADRVNSIEDDGAVLKETHDATLQDLLACSGIIIGSPGYFGCMNVLEFMKGVVSWKKATVSVSERKTS